MRRTFRTASLPVGPVHLTSLPVVSQRDVGDWIERVYNRRRRHSALGMISPVDYEDRLTQTAQAA